MLNGFRIYDADAHVMMTPEMWRDLPKEYHLRRPRPISIGDSADLAHWRTAWLAPKPPKAPGELLTTAQGLPLHTALP